jgi:hypothetical protein
LRCSGTIRGVHHDIHAPCLAVIYCSDKREIYLFLGYCSAEEGGKIS